MPPSTPSPLEDQLADIKETLEREKVKLTPEVEEYIRSHLRTVQDKIADTKDITEGDLAFIKKEKIWISLSDKLRDKYPTIKDMEGSAEMIIIQDRHLSVSECHTLFKEAE